MIKRTISLGIMALLCASLALGQESSSAMSNSFGDFSQVGDELFVYEKSQFEPYNGPSVLREKVRDGEDRIRLGIVTLAPRVRVFIDRLNPIIHGSSSFEFTDTNSGTSIGKVDIGLVSSTNWDARLLFNGQGVVYLSHTPPTVCSGKTTRKFVLAAGRLIETPQPLAYLGTDAVVRGNIRLFHSSDSVSPIVANLQDGAKVLVVGLAADSVTLNLQSPQKYPKMLVRTPLGLTGWYLPERSNHGESGLSIMECN